jgi:hypothetical protein
MNSIIMIAGVLSWRMHSIKKRLNALLFRGELRHRRQVLAVMGQRLEQSQRPWESLEIRSTQLKMEFSIYTASDPCVFSLLMKRLES